MSRLRYLGAAFVARPLGMPVPPNLFGLAAAGLLGALVNPGFLAIGAGLELAYLWWLSGNARFQAAVDGRSAPGSAEATWDARREALVAALPRAERAWQAQLEERCGEILDTLQDRPGVASHAEGLANLAWLHLRLLGARVALQQLSTRGAAERGDLVSQEARIAERLARPEVDPELKRTLEQQAEVIRARRDAQAEGAKRLERVDAELERIQQQVALLRDQALLATDEEAVGRSVDALAASLNEATRWLQEEPDLLGGLDLSPAPPARFPRRRAVPTSTGEPR